MAPELIAFAVPLAALLGLLIGSFLNVVILRLPVMMENQWNDEARAALALAPIERPPFNLLTPGSHCPGCRAPIRAWQNIPVLSWLWQRGRCRACAAPISAQYPLVEGLCALLTAAVVWRFGFGLQGLAACVFTWVLLAAAVIDLRTTLLPDTLTLSLLWLGLIAALLPWPPTPSEAIAGAALGFLCLWGVYWLFKLLTGKEGMGYGDFKLLAALGAWCGPQLLPMIILLSSLVGALAGLLWLRLGGRERDTQIPFGPYLAAAGWIALCWGDALSAGYWRLFGG